MRWSVRSPWIRIKSPIKKLSFIIGPTASGKTALALALAEHQPIEIISLDSALVYRDMNIGTAKPSAEELASVPHHLIDIIDPTETLSVADTCRRVRTAIDEIEARGHQPVCVGGSMMTVHALMHGLSDLPEANLEVRSEIDAQAKLLGWPALHARLQAVDAVSAARIDANDAQRIQRALEVFQITGHPLAEVQGKRSQFLTEHQPHILMLMPSDRAQLHARIAERLQLMFANGFLDEVRHLQVNYALTSHMTSMRAVGYRQVWAYLAGEINYLSCQEQSLFATRQLAKRQITWMRSILNTLDASTYQLIDPFHCDLDKVELNL